MKKIIIIVSIIILVAGAAALYLSYSVVFKQNTEVPMQPVRPNVYLPTGVTMAMFIDSVHAAGLVTDTLALRQAAEWLGYSRVFAGHYQLRTGMNNLELLRTVCGGLQTPVKVRFNQMRSLAQLAGIIARQIEADSSALVAELSNMKLIDSLGFDADNFRVMFIPNTYEMYWNIDAKSFVLRIHREYNRFWNETRLQKAKEAGLSPIEVSIMASIVQAEQSVLIDEQPLIAGLYINRLAKGMLLQSDPTVVYAAGIFGARRVLNVDKLVDSPYNTYMYVGLPPGPISIPSLQAIESVLNFEKSNYIYMCAKDDFSGYHYFAETFKEHQVYAQRYQQALTNKGIKR